MRRFLLVGALCAILGLTVAACGRPTPPPAPPPAPPPTAPAPPPPPPPKPAPPPPAAPPPLTEDQIFAQKTVDQLNAERPLADVLFDYDSATLRDDGRSAASRNADYLKRWQSVRITVEGHADSRGTSEYNLALGERRALAARDYLVSLGIPATRVRKVSYGKEFPFDPGHDEAAWANNRRAQFVVTSK
jgi:peptidoglycan-associated lipoprotein